MSDRAPLSAEEIRQLGRKFGSWPAASRATGRSVSQIKSRASALGIKLSDCVDGESSTESIATDAEVPDGDVRRLIESRGLNPNDYLVTRVRVNEWADERQLRVDLEPVTSVLMPARTEGWRPPKIRKRPRKGRPELTVVVSDHHVPHHSKPMHRAFVRWLETHKPDKGIIAGDLMNFGPVSRHRLDTERPETLQDTLDQTWSLLRDYLEASPGTEWSLLSGNHEDRLRNTVLDQLSAVAGLRRADDKGWPVLSIPSLLRLDELGIRYVGGGDDYRHAQIEITPTLACRHGWIASKGSGSSALKTLKHLNYSVIVGHTHRQSIIYASTNRIDGSAVTLLGAETGTMAEVDATGLGYAPSPDWQNGFLTVTAWDPDDSAPQGTFKVDAATWVCGRLLWRDWSCEG